MKNLKMTLAAIALASVSFGSFAADLVSSQPADLQQSGVITVSGASDLTSLENKLAAKADAAGAKSFQNHRNNRQQQTARHRDYL